MSRSIPVHASFIFYFHLFLHIYLYIIYFIFFPKNTSAFTYFPKSTTKITDDIKVDVT